MIRGPAGGGGFPAPRVCTKNEGRKPGANPPITVRAGPIERSASAARALFDPRLIAEDLASNMAQPVNWHDTARLAWERGARLAIEMPSGTVLTGLTQPAFADGLAVGWEKNRVETRAGLVWRVLSLLAAAAETQRPAAITVSSCRRSRNRDSSAFEVSRTRPSRPRKLSINASICWRWA